MKQWQRFPTFKQRGEWVELQFMAATALHGYHVLKPWGESLAYDVAIEQKMEPKSRRDDRIERTVWGGWPRLFVFPSHFGTVGAPSLRFLQGRVAMLPLPFCLSCRAACIAATALIICTLLPCSCYRRLPLLRTACSRDLFLSILEQTRERYRFVVVGYVVMPEHVHLLITEPEVGTPSTVMQVLKQRTARALLPKKERVDTRTAATWRSGSAHALAGSFLRLQCVDDEQACRKAEVYAS